MLLQDKLKTKDFIITAELTPPKGTDCQTMFQVAQDLKEKVDAVNVTDSPMAKMKMSSIMAGHFIQEETGLEVIPHVTCRDKNIIALQGELLGASKLGINNILAITGDDPTRGDHPQASPVFDTNSIGVIKTVQKLNQGFDTNDNQLTGTTDLTVATAGNLGADDLDEEIARLETKVTAGADFIQTQPAYDLDLLKKFLDKTNHLDVPILIGVLPLTSYKMAQYLDQNVPGVEIPTSILARMKGKKAAEGVKISSQFLKQVSDLINGIHIMSANRSDILLDVLNEVT
ncbi:5,10-methylenetetrahydrofolate reductase [Halobacteroides halobius DSM 5150]|uniref:Methylenetetrahydrofolate reductase n=1 Tax=Halobacteroides halobius (strain ATCC 35273 / DSM 5150 / MD-1) TaxID=748449 RepID=L0K8A7_HALHC|nr:methylenetetrahydrofolate reductase [Halobacteroides halobius]AGB41256.1 5,10-methylenetetrahydrofolate reductase [Halobacteroides halobius DSM 5150]